MRFESKTTALAERVAKHLRDIAKANGATTRLSACRDAVAGMHGYSDWRELKLNAGKKPPSADDVDAPADVVAARRAHHIAVLRRSLPALAKDAAEIVDAIGPTRRAPPAPGSDDDDVVFFDFETETHVGVGISYQDHLFPGWPPRTNVFVIRKSDGLIASVCGNVRTRDPSAIVAWLGTEPEARPDVYRAYDTIDAWLDIAGFAEDETGWSDRFHRALGSRVDTARDTILKHVDREAFLALTGAGTRMTASDYYHLSRKAGDRARRLAFLAAYPDFLLARRFDRRKSLAVIDASPTPRDALVRMLTAGSDLSETDADRVVVRIGANRWKQRGKITLVPDDFTDLKILRDLDERLIPGTPKEIDAFLDIVFMLQHAFLSRIATHGLVGAIATSIPGDSWEGRKATWTREAEETGRRLKIGGAFTPGDYAIRFFGGSKPMIERFAWRVLLPLIGRTDRTARYVYEGGTQRANAGRNDRPLVPPLAFEACCARVFLEGIDYAGMADLMERWHPFGRDAARHADILCLRTQASMLASRLDDYRPFLRDAYRDATPERIVEVCLAELSAAGAAIAGEAEIPPLTDRRYILGRPRRTAAPGPRGGA